MQDQETLVIAQAQTSLVINQVINYWENSANAITTIYNKNEDEFYFRAVAPGRNRAIYILAHMIAINDTMLPLFGLGEKLYPELTPFAHSAEHLVPLVLDITELKVQWQALTLTLASNFRKMSSATWLDRHNSVTEENFLSDPSRNKLNVLIHRTGHQDHHKGQLAFLNEKAVTA
ncbi:MAG: DinB family protein [Bacteroidota bacterium]|nr:DinB family protein [Bacteroidota bacterium]